VDGEVRELRLTVARLEGAAKRLLELLGRPVDARKGKDATLDELRAAAEALAVGKTGSGISGHRVDWDF
jgi:hypothetical protein